MTQVVESVVVECVVVVVGVVDHYVEELVPFDGCSVDSEYFVDQIYFVDFGYLEPDYSEYANYCLTHLFWL